MAARGGEFVEADGLGKILGDALAVGVGVAEGVERIGIAGLREGAHGGGIGLGAEDGQRRPESKQRGGKEGALAWLREKLAGLRFKGAHGNV